MYYFIPAWYDRRTNFGRRLLILGTASHKNLNLMTACTQVRIFQDEDLAPQLLLLAYQPHLRYFLHRHMFWSWLYGYF